MVNVADNNKLVTYLRHISVSARHFLSPLSKLANRILFKRPKSKMKAGKTIYQKYNKTHLVPLGLQQAVLHLEAVFQTIKN